MKNNSEQINQALNILSQLIPLVDDAEKKLSSARTWSFIDVLGGGFFTNLIKHSKLNNASYTMEQVDILMKQLQRVLGSIEVPEDYKMYVGNFSTFADFIFDGAIIDIYMTSKIMSSLTQVRSLREKLLELKTTLNQIK